MERGQEGAGLCPSSSYGSVDFFHPGTFLPTGRIADFQLCTDMFPSSAHIDDTLVSIVTKGE